MPATSHHRSSSSPNQVPSSSKHKKSKPIQIPGSEKRSKVIIVLPPQMAPPALPSSPSHRTAPSPQPVLISSSYPGRHHSGSSSSPSSTPPGAVYNVKFSASSGSYPKPRPTFQGSGPSPSSITPQISGYAVPKTGSASGRNVPTTCDRDFTRATVTGPTIPSGSMPMARAASMDAYTRSTVTRGMIEEEYYDHPAVRAYELQKAAEQARWTRQRQMANAQRRAQNVPQGRW